MAILVNFSSSKDPVILFNLFMEPCLLTLEAWISATGKKYGEAFMPVGSCFSLLMGWLQVFFFPICFVLERLAFKLFHKVNFL